MPRFGRKMNPPVNEASRPQLNGTGAWTIRFVNVPDHYATVYQRMFLVHGTIQSEDSLRYEGTVAIKWYGGYPDQHFPVSSGYFKALVPLEPGRNQVKFEIIDEQGHPVMTHINLTYIPLMQNPPVHFCLILGKDSKGTFDSPRYKKEQEGNGLELAKRKMRMASYMMAAFTQEQMYRNGFDYRTFRPYEEREVDTISNRESDVRFTTHVHVIRSEKTVAEILDPEKAQQNPKGRDTGALFGIALEALKKYGGPFNTGQPVHVACLFLDTHWDPELKLVRGHAALGGGSGDIRLAIFGSHALHAWPSCLEEVVPSFMDDTRTDTSQVANDSNQSGTSWEALNIGMGAFMHEIGHLLGCPHEPSGVMLRDYITWNRSFMTREAFSARLNKQGLLLCLPKDECSWHRLDVLRFRFHPSFRLASDPIIRDGAKPNLYPSRNGVYAKSDTGIYLIEIHVKDQVRGFFSFPDSPVHEWEVSIDTVIAQLDNYDVGNEKIKLEILAVGEQQITVDDLRSYLSQKHYFLHPRGNQPLFKSDKLGGASGEEQVVIFPDDKRITTVRVFTGNALDGIDFIFSDGSALTFGKHGGTPKEVDLSQIGGLAGFSARTGAWVDAIQFIGQQNRRTPVYGNAKGGSRHDFVPPPEFQMVGIYGNVGAWVVSLGIVYASNYYKVPWRFDHSHVDFRAR